MKYSKELKLVSGHYVEYDSIDEEEELKFQEQKEAEEQADFERERRN